MINWESKGFFGREREVLQSIESLLGSLRDIDRISGGSMLACDERLPSDVLELVCAPKNLKANLSFGIQGLSKERLPREFANRHEQKTFQDLYLRLADESREMLQIEQRKILDQIRYQLDMLANPKADPNMGTFFGWVNSMLSEREAELFKEITVNAFSSIFTRSRQGDIKFSLLTLPLQVLVQTSHPNFEWFRYPNGFGLRRNPWSVIPVWNNLIEIAVSESKDPLETSVGFFRERR